jgi:hypothetical protein
MDLKETDRKGVTGSVWLRIKTSGVPLWTLEL